MLTTDLDDFITRNIHMEHITHRFLKNEFVNEVKFEPILFSQSSSKLDVVESPSYCDSSSRFSTGDFLTIEICCATTASRLSLCVSDLSTQCCSDFTGIHPYFYALLLFVFYL